MYLRSGTCGVLDNFSLSNIDRDLASSLRHIQDVESGALDFDLHPACHRYWGRGFYIPHVPPSTCLLEGRTKCDLLSAPSFVSVGLFTFRLVFHLDSSECELTYISIGVS